MKERYIAYHGLVVGYAINPRVLLSYNRKKKFWTVYKKICTAGKGGYYI